MSDPVQIDRRKFLGTLTTGALSTTALGSSLLSLPAHAQPDGGYQTLDVPMLTGDADSVEVLEFFWFGCPHCYAFEPSINAWNAKKPEHVTFVREAPPLNPSWENHSRAFYAGQALGITEGFFDPMFDRIHKDRKPMRSVGQIAGFVEELDLGVSEDDFSKAMKSFGVNTAMNRSLQRARQAGITGVPSIIVNGKYRTANSLAGSNQGIIAVIEKLVEHEHTAAG